MKAVNKSRRGAEIVFPDFPRKRALDQFGMQVGGRGAVAAFIRSHGDENSKFFNQWAAQNRTGSTKTAPAEPGLGSGKREP